MMHQSDVTTMSTVNTNNDSINNRSKGLSPIRKRLHFHTNTAQEKARRLKWAIGLYFAVCVSLSFLLFTWTVTATVDIEYNSGSGSMSLLESTERFGLRNPFHRVAMSRSLLKVGDYSNHHRKEKEQSKFQPPMIQQQQQFAVENAIAPVTRDHDGISDELRIPDDEPIVQIISTRFMQNQPNLVELGLARLELLKTICLPTLQQQSSQNFLWIIRADPALAAPVRQGLLDAIRNATIATPDFHVVVIGTDDNPGGFRRPQRQLQSHDAITAADIWTDNFSLLQHFHEASQSRIVLETRLDADDGLHVYFVELMQEEAELYLQDSSIEYEYHEYEYEHEHKMGESINSTTNNSTKKWLVWCSGTHVEWQYGTPWGDLSQSHSSILLNGTELSTSRADESWQMKQQAPYVPPENKTEAEDSAFGSLLPGLTRGCITPGLTKGYSPRTAFEDIPDAQHHQLHWMLAQCHDEGEEGASPLHEQCLVIWKRLVPNAIRGRTPTSAGMQFVLGKHISYMSDEAKEALGLEANNYHGMQGMMWNSVMKRFKITKESIAQMRTFLADHMHGVALDNLEGQCTKGHSCKNSSQVLLKELLKETDQ